MVSSSSDDPIEFIGSDRSTRADPPKSKAAPAPKVEAVPKVAHYEPPKSGEAHPKIARKSVAARLDKAEAALHAANTELHAARAALQSAQMDEGDAERDLIALLPTISPDELLRQHARAQTQQRADRVAAGQSPEAKPTMTPGRSPLDLAAAQRAKTSSQAASTPLRSPVRR